MNWISCDDKMPKENVDVIIYNQRRGGQYDIFIAQWNGWKWVRTGQRTYKNVTHWMPLPTPPYNSNSNKGEQNL